VSVKIQTSAMNESQPVEPVPRVSLEIPSCFDNRPLVLHIPDGRIDSSFRVVRAGRARPDNLMYLI